MTAVIHVDQAIGGGLGASQAAQALGLNPWGAPIELWEELTGRRPRREPGAAARWGQILEPVVRGVYVEAHGCAVRVPEVSLYHPAKPWLRATPDGVALAGPGERALIVDGEAWTHLVQVKCPGLRQAPHWGTDEKREVPIYYYLQAAVEMAVTGLARCDFAVLLGGQEYFEVTVRRDEELEGDILDSLAEFWTCVASDHPPPVDASSAYGRYLTTLLDTRTKRALEASPELEVAIGRWREVREALAQLTVEESLLKNRLLAAAVEGKAKRITSGYGTVPIVESSSTRRGWEELARGYGKQLGADVEADIESHTTRSPYAFVRAPAGWNKEDDHG